MREKERETQREERERERYVKSRLEINVTIPEADYLPFSGHNQHNYRYKDRQMDRQIERWIYRWIQSLWPHEHYEAAF